MPMFKYKQTNLLGIKAINKTVYGEMEKSLEIYDRIK
jgi:hypothetical protein